MDKTKFVKNGWKEGVRIRCTEWDMGIFVKIQALGARKFFTIDNFGDEEVFGYAEYEWEKFEDLIDFSKLNNDSIYPEWICSECLSRCNRVLELTVVHRQQYFDVTTGVCPCCGRHSEKMMSTKDAGYPVVKVLPWAVVQ